MTHISIVFRKVGSLVISTISSNSDKPVQLYNFSSTRNEARSIITELHELIDPYDTEIILINFPKGTKLTYFNQLYGSLMTLKRFGLINKLTFIDDPHKMYKRICKYVNAGKKRRRSLNGVSKMLLDGSSCWFYDNSLELIISNKSLQEYNLFKMSIIGLFYMIVKNRLQGE